MSDLNNIFTPKTESIYDFFSANGRGFFIPIYQRPYTWGKEQIESLFDDIFNGFESLLTNESNYKTPVTFLGSIIAVINQNRELYTNKPHEAPENILNIIDGQQRLSTLFTLLTILHCKINLEYYTLFSIEEIRKIDYSENDEDIDNKIIIKIISDLSETLRDCIMERQKTSKSKGAFYPKIARATKDVWDVKKGEYRSPIANFIHNYINIFITEENYSTKECTDCNEFKKFYNSLKNELNDFGRTDKDYKTHNSAVKLIKEKIEDFLQNKNEEYYPTIDDYKNFKKNQGLTNFDLTVFFKDEKFIQLGKLAFLAYFILNRICITTITAQDEDYAFDIFESLNTTGEPLTAIETFKPKVIQWKEKINFIDSDESKMFDHIKYYLDKYSKNESDKASLSGELVIQFAQLYAGRKIGNKLNYQRSFLKSFDEKNTDKAKFVETLSDIAIFYAEIWNEGIYLDQEATFCLSFLRDLKHTILVPLLVAYSKEILNERKSLKDQQFSTDNKDLTTASKNLNELIKACTAFSVIWRAYFGATKGIDQIYRNLLSQGYPYEKDFPKDQKIFQNFNIASNNPLPSVSDIKKAFNSILKEKAFKNYQEWETEVLKNDFFPTNKLLARFILFVAIDKTVTDPNQEWIRIKGKDQLTSILDKEAWESRLFSTIEHIAPQNNNNWQSMDIYDQKLEHKIGNLTLLPQDDNSRVSNVDWNTKQIYYKFLSAKTTSDEDEILKEINSKEQNYLRKFKEHYTQGKYKHIEFVTTVANWPTEWTPDSVQERGKNICSCAWETLMKWLE